MSLMQIEEIALCGELALGDDVEGSSGRLWKERIALNGWFVQPRRNAFTAPYELGLYMRTV